MGKQSVFILFPHQLFLDMALLKEAAEVVLVEEFLFFNQYKFHKQKLAMHRASMKYYENLLVTHNIKVSYIEATQPENDIQLLIEELHQKGISSIVHYDVCDNWLEKRITSTCNRLGLEKKEIQTPLFINTKEDLHEYFGSRKKYFHNDFYIQQRKKRNILVDAYQNPIGGRWSFDAENRLKYPKCQKPPKVIFPAQDAFYKEAIQYVERHYANNYGKLSSSFLYPITHEQASQWLKDFLEQRFSQFGEYEDAIVGEENILHHSVLTPMLNIGLLLPMQIIDAAIRYADKYSVPINSLEGFVRQVLGWREFIRGVYVYKGTQERTTNYWGYNKPMPSAFYDGSTGIEPIDVTIKKVLDTAYCHHIERLMVLGNFMLLVQLEPDAVYQWFMEMFIDAYDWVMVPNVYGMSQFADGGLMATKPYISGSSYVLKMSNYKKGNWCLVWDALFWNFMDRHRQFFSSNPRIGMLLATYDKMSEEKKQSYKDTVKCLAF